MCIRDSLEGDGIVFEFGIGSGNGAVREEVGVSVRIATFNGTDNNLGFPIGVGQNLEWDVWHNVELRADLQSSKWISISVNGDLELLDDVDLPRNFGAKGPFTPATMNRVTLQVVNGEGFGDETSDSIFFDNLSIAGVLLGDVNCDNTVNLLDVGPFVSQLISGEYSFKADVNQDNTVDLLDIEPFVELFGG